MMSVSKEKQSGLALITVLMILAIMVTVATTMSGRLVLALKRTEGIIFSQKSYWYGQSAAELGRMVLDEDFADSEVTSLDQMWATPDMIFPLDNGQISGGIKDLRSCFNVNSLIQPAKESDSDIVLEQFETLLEALGVDDYSVGIIAESTRDWIDENNDSESSKGAEDSFYQGLNVPYLAANNLLVEISELRAIQGVDKDIYKKIAPYLCAIPSVEQKINVNTVSVDQPEILYALFKASDDSSIADFKSLLEERPSSGWDSVNDFLDNSLFTVVEVTDQMKKQLSVSSEYFQYSGVAQFEDRYQAFEFVYQIDENKASVIRYQAGGLK